jgi:hypothetical protein
MGGWVGHKAGLKAAVKREKNPFLASSNDVRK